MCVFNGDATDIAFRVNIEKGVFIEVFSLNHFRRTKLDIQRIGILKILNLQRFPRLASAGAARKHLRHTSLGRPRGQRDRTIPSDKLPDGIRHLSPEPDPHR